MVFSEIVFTPTDGGLYMDSQVLVDAEGYKWVLCDYREEARMDASNLFSLYVINSKGQVAQVHDVGDKRKLDITDMFQLAAVLSGLTPEGNHDADRSETA